MNAKQKKAIKKKILELNPFLKSVEIYPDLGTIEYQLKAKEYGYFRNIEDLINIELEKLSDKNIEKKRKFWENLRKIK